VYVCARGFSLGLSGPLPLPHAGSPSGHPTTNRPRASSPSFAQGTGEPMRH
jgi:hypothetical protein